MLVAGGKEIACPVDVLDWMSSGLAFRKLPMRKKTTKIALHWTGGFGDARRLHRTLTGDGNSVHFCVDVNGAVYQYCDADSRCEHAGKLDDGITSANPDTIGIEIVNHAGEVQSGVERPMVTDIIHGHSVVHTDFLPAQIEAALALTKALCAHYDLPYVVPTRGGEVLSTSMPRGPWEAFRGVVGHLHVRRQKKDPGLSILRKIHEASHASD